MKFRKISFVIASMIFIAARSAAGEMKLEGFSEDLPLKLEADRLEYHKDDNIMFAAGNVSLGQGEYSILADCLIIYMNENRLEAYDNISFKKGSSVLFGEKMTFDWSKKTGEITPGSGKEGYWHYSGKRLEKINDEKIIIYRAKFTSCDLNPPHYYIYGTKATIKIGKWMFIRNAFLFVDKAPVFYSPVFFKSLKDRKISLEVKPGYSKSDGVKILSKIGIPTSSNTYLKLLIDYYEMKGTGRGMEFNYYNENAKGSFYGYNIKEKNRNTGAVNERWNFLLNHWQKHDIFGEPQQESKKGEKRVKKNPATLTSQARMEYQSDTDFNKDYFKDAYKRVSQNLNSSAAMTLQSDFGTARISTDRYDAFNQSKNEFEIERLTAPRFDFYVNRKKIPNIPVYLSFSNYFQRYYSGSTDYYRNSGGAAAGIGSDVRIGRITTFSHSYGWSETWLGRVKSADMKDVYQARYTAEFNLRNRLTSAADLDFTHNYKVRMRDNSTIQDTKADDKGIEQNLLSAFLLVRPMQYFTSRTSAGYNFHKNKNEEVNTIVEKMTPVSEEINIQFPEWFDSSFFGRGSYSPENHWMETLQLGYSLNPSRLYSFSFNSSYNKSQPGAAVFSGKVKMRLFENWYLKGSLGFKGTGPNRLNYDSFDFYDRQVKIVRDLHCFIFEMTYRMLGVSEEVMFNLMMKLDYLKREKIAADVREYEFYPWRGE